MEHINDERLPEPAAPYSQIVIHDRYAFVSGLVAADLAEEDKPAGTDFEAEARAVLEGLAALCARQGLKLSRAVRIDVHLTDLELMPAFDRIYAEVVTSPRPARTCVGVHSLFGGCRVEVTAMVAL